VSVERRFRPSDSTRHYDDDRALAAEMQHEMSAILIENERPLEIDADFDSMKSILAIVKM